MRKRPARMRMTAAELQRLHGGMLATAPYVDLKERRLVKALAEQGILITDAVARMWASKYRTPVGAERMESADELEERYGEDARRLVSGDMTAYKLCVAFRRRSPKVFLSDSVAKAWLAKYGGVSAVHEVLTAGHIELWYGDRIRAEYHGANAGALRTWLLEICSVRASERVCQAWVSRDWSCSGKLVSVDAVERELGERLRLAEYAEYFGSDATAQALVDRLSEGDPAFVVSSLLLRQWYARWHPQSGPLRYDTAEGLEAGLGAELRQQYPGFQYRRLQTVLGQRIKAVLVSERTCRTWVQHFGAPAPRMPLKRPAGSVFRRPAAAAKRPRVSASGSADAAPPVTPAKRPRVSASASADKEPLVSATVLADAAALERECGPRYRREHCDLGLGHTWKELQAVLVEWGYEAGSRICRTWLSQYRLGDGAKDGGASVYVLARDDLMRWYHVEGLTGLQLTDKYRSVHGVYSHPTPLMKWLKAPAQALSSLDNNEDHE